MEQILYKLASGLNIPKPPISGEAKLENGLNKVFVWAGIIAVLMIVIAGFKYVSAAGDPSKVASAKNSILYSIIGLILVALSFAIVNFVAGLF